MSLLLVLPPISLREPRYILRASFRLQTVQIVVESQVGQSIRTSPLSETQRWTTPYRNLQDQRIISRHQSERRRRRRRRRHHRRHHQTNRCRSRTTTNRRRARLGRRSLNFPAAAAARRQFLHPRSTERRQIQRRHTQSRRKWRNKMVR